MIGEVARATVAVRTSCRGRRPGRLRRSSLRRAVEAALARDARCAGRRRLADRADGSPRAAADHRRAGRCLALRAFPRCSSPPTASRQRGARRAERRAAGRLRPGAARRHAPSSTLPATSPTAPTATSLSAARCWVAGPCAQSSARCCCHCWPARLTSWRAPGGGASRSARWLLLGAVARRAVRAGLVFAALLGAGGLLPATPARPVTPAQLPVSGSGAGGAGQHRPAVRPGWVLRAASVARGGEAPRPSRSARRAALLVVATRHRGAAVAAQPLHRGAADRPGAYLARGADARASQPPPGARRALPSASRSSRSPRSSRWSARCCTPSRSPSLWTLVLAVAGGGLSPVGLLLVRA